MTSKFSQLQNILQPKRLNSSGDLGRVQKGNGGIGGPSSRHSGATLTLNGVTIGLPSSVHHIAPNCNSVNNSSNSNVTPAKKGPNVMAKRNARERHRVKQVNQGFQTLRNHIPESYRLKKMSKVDTLRCALDYIRSMEQILDISPGPSAVQGDELLMRESSYPEYSSEDINQHLDKIISVEETSLDQSFSSFSDNEEGALSQSLNGSGANNSNDNQHLTPFNFQQQQQQQQQQNTFSFRSLQHQQHQTISDQLQSPSTDCSSRSLNDENNGGDDNNNNDASDSIHSPLRQQQRIGSRPNSSDENFRPASFTQIGEIIQL